MSQKTSCVIIGGGPAGMIAGLLLARAGVEVTVLEKHGDFLRDFRGDTIHPTTLELLDELGLIDDFNAVRHSRLHGLILHDEKTGTFQAVDVGRLNVKYPYIAMAPQWDFLNLLATAGAAEPTFRLILNAEFTEFLYRGDTVSGVRYAIDGRIYDLIADLTIAADGRASKARTQAHLPVTSYPVPIDLWWFRVDTSEPVGEAILPTSANGKIFVVIPREGYVQMAHLIDKGSDRRLRAEGIATLQQAIAHAVPEAARSAKELTWNDVKLLDIEVNRLTRWYRNGLLCIGDAAHAMSPVGGVGVNLAVQDGVAAARILAEPLRTGQLSLNDLDAVQRRREGAAKFTQRLQRVMHQVIHPLITQQRGLTVPGPLKTTLETFPQLGKIPAKLLLYGRRPEHAPDFAQRPNLRA